jgi:hypothetical protein
VDKIPKKENIILEEDFNGRIGLQPIPECKGTYGEQVTNHNGAAFRDVCAFKTLKIINSFYRHKDIHKCTWEARETKSIIDYIIINTRLKNII